MSKSATVPETQNEKTLAAVSLDRWIDHQNRLVPMENKVIADATRDTGSTASRAAATTNADLAQQMPATTANPNGTNATSSAPALQRASVASNAQMNTAQGIQDQQASKLSNVVNFGEGKATTAVNGFETAASNAINSAQTSAANRQTVGDAVGSMVGTEAFALKRSTTPNVDGYGNPTPALPSYELGANTTTRPGATIPSGMGGYNISG